MQVYELIGAVKTPLRGYSMLLSRDAIVTFGAVVALYSLITTIAFWDEAPYLHSALLGPPEDNLQDFWNSWYAATGHLQGAEFFRTNLIKFPEGTTLYYHSFAYPQMFLVWLGTKAIGTDLPHLILLQNLTILISFPLAAVGTFYVVRHVTRNAWSAVVGGYIFAFNPSHVEHTLHHAGVSSIEFIPFFVICYWLALERAGLMWLAGAIVFYALSSLSSWYYLFYMGYFIVFHTVYAWVRDGQPPSGRQLLVPALTALGCVALISPWVVPMISQTISGLNVYIGGFNTYVADVLAYFVFPPRHLLGTTTGSITRHFTGNAWEATAYLGLANLGLLAWYVSRRKTADWQPLHYAAAGGAFFCVLASGPFLHVFGQSILPLPGALHAFLPVFKNLRTPSRALVFIYLFLAIAVAQAMVFLSQMLAMQPTRKYLTLGAICALIVVDFWPAKIDTTPISCTPGDAVIRDDPETDFGVLNLPVGLLNLPGGNIPGNASMAEQVCHRRPIVIANISREVTQSLSDRLEVKDLWLQRKQLIESKVKYIVLRRKDDAIYRWTKKENGERDAYSQTYTAVYKDAEVLIFRVY